MRRRAAVCLLLLLTLTLPAAGAEMPTLGEAQAHLDAGEWAKAASAFAAIGEAQPENAQAWQNLGRARHELGEYEAALAAYARALELGFQPAVSMLLAARTRAVEGKAEEAVGWLEKMAATGARLYQAVATMPELQGLADREDFQAVLQSMKPCTAEEYRQFDFWVGEWDVESASGNKAFNRILPEHGGCVLREDYSAGAYSGSSFSFYDARKGHWHQTWIDNQGSPLFLDGGLEDGKMVLYSPEGTKPRSRVTWTPLPSGQVRQLWESSADEGATWSVVFDGTYTRRQAE